MKAKILVVEDEKSLSEAYELILKSSGYKVTLANDGAEGLELAESFEPDLVLLDLRMPRVSGIEFLRKYQLVDKHPHVKVIVFSNMDTQKEIDEAYELGATHYILKAWASPKELTRLVADTLSNT
ncbi:MAG: response regulator [Candidatus Saccharibacteria bacterium]|nr:response regulator [Candidatus Saccharibacteria bacterium]